ncbi:MAG: conjugal transfer protein TraG [Muricauda sp.]|nr:type IV secretory system conjugative DNA transfer family protein [Allomuricauda sp.]MAU17058.1 conjugal transfer protein TraG [Allomuricauda sp.]MBC32170.1 conjugal transfer protein TraG [Allomuricauda sp.]
MDTTTIIEYIFGGSNPYFRVLLLFSGILLYTIVLRRVLKIPFMIGGIIAIFISMVLPLTIAFPIALCVWMLSGILKILIKPSEKVKPKSISLKTEDSFDFVVDGKPVNLTNPYRGIYVQGGAGSGKSASLVYPILKQALIKNYAGICYDFKSPELASFLFQQAQKSKIAPYLVDFKNPKRSIRVNPLDPNFMHKTAYASEHAQTLMYNLSPSNIKKEDYWMMEAKSVLTGLIWYLKKNHPRYCSLPHVISLLLHANIPLLIEKISEDFEAAGFVASLKQAIKNESTRQVSGVMSTLQTNLSKLNTPDIFWILSGNDISLDINDPTDPKFLCIGNESTLSQTYAPVVSLIISVALKMMNQPEKHKSVVLIDELPTLYINKLEQTPATARSNKIATVLACQDFSQLVDRYGREKAQVILSNMGNQFFGRTVNKESAEMIGRLFGKTDKVFRTTSKGDNYYQSSIWGKHVNSSNSTTGESVQERDRVKTTDIMNLDPGEFYGIIAEGSHTEILKSKFSMNPHGDDMPFAFHNTTTIEEITENYVNIIENSLGLLNLKHNETHDLIGF